MKNYQMIVIVFLMQTFLHLLPAQTPDVTVSVNRSVTINPRSTLLLGITFDARSSMRGNAGPLGYHDTNGVLLPAIQPMFGDFPMPTVRYPANAVMFGFDWKKSVGPPEKRATQNIVGNGPAQPMRFGFDEFMTMAMSHGAQAKDVQIMVTIYSKQTAGLTATQSTAAIDTAALSAADWVEYANAPNNGINWGGGTDWAKVRANNGRNDPYGIEIWNLGNEPWADGEFKNDSAGAQNYLAAIKPILDSMLARDPTVKITIPATGPATSEWNKAMLNSPMLKGKIYGLSPHFFPDETVVNGNVQLGVARVESGLKAIADSAKAKGLKVIVGDYAHGIPMQNLVPIGDPDLAMQWQGANLNADFLMLMSQLKNVERVNYWAYGLPPATWHPIRYNGPGNYTLMPSALIYKKFFPLFLDRSISVSTTSPKGSDGNSYSVRAGGFMTNDSAQITVIIVNRDKVLSSLVQVNGMSGYTVNSILRWRGQALTSDVILEDSITADINGNIALPPMGVVAVKYTRSTLNVLQERIAPEQFQLFQNYPNPFNPVTTIRYSIPVHLPSFGNLASVYVSLIVYDALGREVSVLVNDHQESGRYSVDFDASKLSSGMYIYKLTSGSFMQTKKMLMVK